MALPDLLEIVLRHLLVAATVLLLEDISKLLVEHGDWYHVTTGPHRGRMQYVAPALAVVVALNRKLPDLLKAASDSRRPTVSRPDREPARLRTALAANTGNMGAALNNILLDKVPGLTIQRFSAAHSCERPAFAKRDCIRQLELAAQQATGLQLPRQHPGVDADAAAMAQDKGTLHPYILVFKDVAPGDSPDTIQTKVQATLQAAVTKLREEPAPWAAAEDAPPPPPAGSAGNPVVHMAAAAAPEIMGGAPAEVAGGAEGAPMAEEGAAGMAAVLPGGLPAAGPGPPAMGALAAPGTGAAVAPAMTWTNKQRRRITTGPQQSSGSALIAAGHQQPSNTTVAPQLGVQASILVVCPEAATGGAAAAPSSPASGSRPTALAAAEVDAGRVSRVPSPSGGLHHGGAPGSSSSSSRRHGLATAEVHVGVRDQCGSRADQPEHEASEQVPHTMAARTTGRRGAAAAAPGRGGGGGGGGQRSHGALPLMPTSGAAAAVVVGSGGPVKIKQEMPEGEGTQGQGRIGSGRVTNTGQAMATARRGRSSTQMVPSAAAAAAGVAARRPPAAPAPARQPQPHPRTFLQPEDVKGDVLLGMVGSGPTLSLPIDWPRWEHAGSRSGSFSDVTIRWARLEGRPMLVAVKSITRMGVADMERIHDKAVEEWVKLNSSGFGETYGSYLQRAAGGSPVALHVVMEPLVGRWAPLSEAFVTKESIFANICIDVGYDKLQVWWSERGVPGQLYKNLWDRCLGIMARLGEEERHTRDIKPENLMVDALRSEELYPGVVEPALLQVHRQQQQQLEEDLRTAGAAAPGAARTADGTLPHTSTSSPLQNAAGAECGSAEATPGVILVDKDSWCSNTHTIGHTGMGSHHTCAPFVNDTVAAKGGFGNPEAIKAGAAAARNPKAQLYSFAMCMLYLLVNQCTQLTMPQLAAPGVLGPLLKALKVPIELEEALKGCLDPNPETQLDLAGALALKFSQPDYAGMVGWERPVMLPEEVTFKVD